MPASNRLTWVAAAGVLILCAIVPGGLARSRKGDKLVADIKSAEAHKEWDHALELAELALSQDPADINYQLTATRVRFEVSQYHVDQGKKLRGQGKLQDALAEFEKAYAINPASSIAEEEAHRTKGMIERNAKKPDLPAEDRALTPSQVSRKEADARFATMLPLPELKPLNSQAITLKMNNQPPKVLFETLGKLAGINVLFDPDFVTPGAAKPQSIEFNGSTLEESLDYLAMVTKSFWKPLSGNAIFVTQDNPAKRRDFEEQVVKVFYLQNVTTTQELQEIVTALRTVAEIQKVFTYQSQNAVIARAEADKIALAEKIVADLDKPRSEVLVDILVMIVSKNKTLNLAAAVAPTGINSPINFTPRPGISSPTTPNASTGSNANGGTTITTTPSNSIPLSNLGRVSTADFSMTLPGGLLEAMLSDSNTKVLQSPQVRAIDGQKVSLKIGQRVPYATGSFQPGIGGVGINPLVNTQFTFLDVGVIVDMTPKIHGPDEVSLHVEVEISNVSDHVNLGGIDQPVVSTSKIINDVRLRQGEVNLLGGLMQKQDTKTVTGVPGLASIPVLGKLFQANTVNHTDSEYVLAIIPHIVRSPDITDVNLRGIAAGNSTTVKLNYAPRKGPIEVVLVPVSPASAAATIAPATPPRTAPPVSPVPGVPFVPGGVPGGPLAPVQRNAEPVPDVKPPVPPTENIAAGDLRVLFAPAEANVELNQPFSVSVNVENPADLFSAPLTIKFDPKILRLNEVAQGALLARDGQPVEFTKNILNDQGEAAVGLKRFPGATGITAQGGGTLITLTFQAVGRGDTVVTLPQLTLRNAKGQTISAAVPQLTIRVK